MSKILDQTDYRILHELQKDSSQSQRSLSDKLGLSQNACWRRLKALETKGVILNRTVTLNRSKLGVDLVVFVMVKTRYHSGTWLTQFRNHVLSIPEITDFFRIGGEYDYLLKIVTRDMASFDEVYIRLIAKVELETVTSFFSMEAIAEQRPISLR
ncbi:AsnC family transcriptional regulator [Octadecabacter antarcticus 307]|uniref:AsnC family transcriptional regulator n=1 Tax=Octadecabacter antarcticus 307 TaxID=391626 RepID=M9R5J8_9RHOB|nr:Lrp/AsnC family transcriptional regulator [Octadecabacter antarcticus]AGI67462.1 AsnC family transcriptional regulator [Octadecabacter antarcticus 307]